MSNTDSVRTTAGFITKVIELLPRNINPERMKQLQHDHPGDLRQLLQLLADENEEEFRRFIEWRNGTHEITPIDYVIDLAADPYLPNSDWEVVEHRGEGIVSIERRGDELFVDGRKVELFIADEQEGDYTSGTKLRDILADEPVLNANVLDYLLEHQELIPESWKGQYVFFWGTTYSDPGGGSFVRCLYWVGSEWQWRWRWLGVDWRAVSPAALLAK